MMSILMQTPPPERVTDVTTWPSRHGPCLSEWLDNRHLLMIGAGSLIGLFVLATFYTLYFAQAIFFPISAAIILKLILGPVILRLHKWGVPDFVSAGMVVAGIVGLIAVVILFLSGPASKWLDDAPRHFRELEYKLQALKEPMKRVSHAGEQVAALTEVERALKPLPVQVQQPGLTASLLNTTGEIVGGSFLTLVLLYFLLAGRDRLLERILRLTPEWQSKKNVVAMVREVQQSISSYLFAMTCINIVLGIVIGVGMWLVGLPNPALWGVMAAGLNYIPYFGCLVGGCIVFLVGLISLESVGQAAWAPTIYYAANAIEAYFITPSILGRSIRLSPLAIVISMVLWGWLWGVGGMLLAVPILAATRIACDRLAPLQPVSRFLAD